MTSQPSTSVQKAPSRSASAQSIRASMVELAREVGMSAPAVRGRVTRLEETGVIRGYRLDVDPAAIVLPVAAWMRIRPGPGQLPKIAELADRSPQVSECHRISGEDCFLLKVQVARIEDLEEVLNRFLLHGQTTSSFVVSTPVPGPAGAAELGGLAGHAQSWPSRRSSASSMVPS